MAKEADSDDLLCFNGVNGATGDYGLPPMTGDELVQLIQGGEVPDDLDDLKHRKAQEEDHCGVREGVDPKKLEEAGWGVIFPDGVDPAVKDALAPLLDLRREQAGGLFRLYEKDDGYQPGDAKIDFLVRHGYSSGVADPERVPYYLLIVGSPEAVPYRFQSQLDVQYAVGRIHFESLQEYANYAESVVAAETGRLALPRQVSFFGVENKDDQATRLSTRHLVSPLVEHMRGKRSDWRVETRLRAEATKAGLARMLGGGETPALLFTASHGMEFPNGDARQQPHQGALLCGDWPGPADWRGKGPIPQEFYFSGDDLAVDASLLGLIGFFFACYGAGTPLHDEFARPSSKKRRRELAPHAFLAALPTKMLSHPRGGALAAVGHVERAWGYSFGWPGVGSQTVTFESTLDRLLKGYPVGAALDDFDLRYAELSTELADLLEQVDFGYQADPRKLATLWTANNDARGYVVIGDPAVRLRVAGPGEDAKERPVIEVRTVEPEASEPPPEEAVADLHFGVSEEAEDSAVRFSAYHPRALGVGESRKLLLYAHLLAARQAIGADAGQVLGKEAGEYGESVAAAPAAIAPGTEITVVPRADGLAFDPPQASIAWSGAWQRTDFEMTATGERVGHVIEGSIACYVGPLLIADVRLPVVVPKSGEEVAAADAGRDVQSATMYQSVFASYSHADTPVVEAMETACKALGMDYLRDVMTLKSGQSWSDSLLDMIEQADVFQLFWSPAASESPYVEQEWRHALNLVGRRGAAFIRPIYWQKPLAPVPSGLSHIHFAPVDLSAWIGSAAESPTEQVPAEVVPQAIADLGEELTTLTVSTYAAADPDDPASARLKARTRVSLTGDVEVYLPEGADEQDYLSAHADSVREAVQARLAYLELIVRGSGG